MSCACSITVEDIEEAVRRQDFVDIEEQLKRKSDSQRAAVLRLFVKNGDPSVYDLILDWIPNLTVPSQAAIVLAAAESENIDLLELFFKADNIFDEDVFITAFYKYIEGNPRRHIIKLMWRNFHDYEQASIDIAIKMKYQLNLP